MTRVVSLVFCVAFSLASAGCSFLYDSSVDPGQTVPVESVMKSLRCELMTFFEVNRLRIRVYEAGIGKVDFQENFQNYVYMDLDPTRYGSIDANFKTIDTLGLTLGVDWTNKFGSISKDWHLGPGLTGTKTYNREVVFAVPQDGRLGADVRQTDGSVSKLESSPLADPNSPDRSFFCYLQIPGDPIPRFSTRTIADAREALLFLEALSHRGLPQYENFERIWIDGTTTLANWLEGVSAEMAKGFFSAQKAPYTGALIPGQVNYTFGLELKPSIDFKVTYMASIISPASADLSASRDNTGSFQLFLNTTHAAASFGGKTGTALIDQPAKSVAWGPVADHTVEQEKKYVIPPSPPSAGAGASGRQSTYGTRSPSYRLESPIPLPLPPPAGQQ
jgi:hypothetical protein